MTQIVRHCEDCDWDRPFDQLHDQPDQCPDAPDGECPEWYCTTCGAAVLIGVVLPMTVRASTLVRAGAVIPAGAVPASTVSIRATQPRGRVA
jgi:hypothetical protein